jgi:hypothetical protein
MNLIEFQGSVKKICSYYERKIPNDNTLDLWFEKTKNIPLDSVSWIERKIFEENESYPKNLPSIMWALYSAWLAAHPEKRAFKNAVSCPDCEEGWLVLEKQENYKQPTSYSAACGRCKQVSAGYYMTLEKALKAGYKRKDLKTYPGSVNKDLKSLIDRIGERIK